MYYFKYYLNIAAVQDAEQAQKYIDAGWEKITQDQFIELWKQRSERVKDDPADGANARGIGEKKGS